MRDCFGANGPRQSPPHEYVIARAKGPRQSSTRQEIASGPPAPRNDSVFGHCEGPSPPTVIARGHRPRSNLPPHPSDSHPLLQPPPSPRSAPPPTLHETPLRLHHDQPPRRHALCRRYQQPARAGLASPTQRGQRLHAKVQPASPGVVRTSRLHVIGHLTRKAAQSRQPFTQGPTHRADQSVLARFEWGVGVTLTHLRSLREPQRGSKQSPCMQRSNKTPFTQQPRALQLKSKACSVMRYI